MHTLDTVAAACLWWLPVVSARWWHKCGHTALCRAVRVATRLVPLWLTDSHACVRVTQGRLLQALDEIKRKLPWVESLDVSMGASVELENPDDDLKREVALCVCVACCVAADNVRAVLTAALPRSPVQLQLGTGECQGRAGQARHPGRGAPAPGRLLCGDAEDRHPHAAGTSRPLPASPWGTSRAHVDLSVPCVARRRAAQVKDKLIFEQKKMAAVEQRKREKEQRQCVAAVP